VFVEILKNLRQSFRPWELHSRQTAPVQKLMTISFEYNSVIQLATWAARGVTLGRGPPGNEHRRVICPLLSQRVLLLARKGSPVLAGEATNSLRVSGVIFFVIIGVFVVFAFVFLVLAFVWLLSEEGIGSYRPIRRAWVEAF
jgi:hypothetical protein